VRFVSLLAALTIIIAILVACAAPAAPTAPATTKQGAAATSAPASPATAPAVAATAAPAVATKPATSPSAAPAATAKIKRGGSLRYAEASTYPTMDPVLSSAWLNAAFRLMYDSLFSYERDESTDKWSVKPELATASEQKDPKTIVIALRKGVKYHDGTDFNADVAKWSLERARDNPKSFAKTYLEHIASIDKVDDSSIRLNLKYPFAPMLIFLTGAIPPTAMLPKDAVTKAGDDAFGNKPVGSGPFQFVEWVRDNQVTVKRFDGYWGQGADGKALPYLDTVIIKYVTDPAVSILELRSGNLEAVTEIEAKDVAAVKANPALAFSSNSWTGSFYFSYGFNQKSGPFATNLKLRQAFQYAINREAMSQALGFGVTRPHSQPYWSPGMLGYDDTLPKYSFDIAKAKATLAEAGFPNGTDITMTVINRPAEQRIAEMAKQMLDQAGLKTTLEVWERLAWIDKMKANNFNVGFWRPLTQVDPDWVTFEVGTGAPGNWANFSEPELDKCMAEGRQELDLNKRADIYKKCQRIIYETSWIGTSFFDPKNVAHLKTVQGIKYQFFVRDFRAAWLDK
jgi:ABC-type transport system substrate-binding protein